MVSLTPVSRLKLSLVQMMPPSPRRTSTAGKGLSPWPMPSRVLDMLWTYCRSFLSRRFLTMVKTRNTRSVNMISAAASQYSPTYSAAAQKISSTAK